MDPISKTTMLGSAGAGGGEGPDVDDVFSTFLYNGTGSAQTITNGIDLAGEGGMVLQRRREVIGHWFLSDTENGADNFLYTNLTNGLGIGTSGSSFNSDGFTIGAENNLHGPGNNVVSWSFRKALGFFDIVTYTGDANNGRTISHNLGSVPGSIWVKRLDGSDNWTVYHRGTDGTAPEDYALFLNTTDARSDQDLFADTAPTASVFSVGDNVKVNGNGNTYVAYIFAHDAGRFGDSGSESVIKCGSYTGNGSTSGPVIDLGWEPQWVFIKCASRTYNGNTYGGNGYILDNMRGINTGSLEPQLQADESNGEGISSNIDISLTPTGFQLTNTGVGGNASGGTYIYIAIRRGPMKTPTDATEVFDIATATSYALNAEIPCNFAPDFMITTSRSTPLVNYTEARLTDNWLETNSSNAEDSTNYFQWDGEGGKINLPLAAFAGDPVFYQYRRAPGFFDVVTYTGTGAARLVSHNLSAVPELIIVKRRNGSGWWYTYSAPVGNTGALAVNRTDGVDTATSYWNNQSPTNAGFYVGTNSDTNGNTFTFVAYLFATLDGISKVGSYTGTGSNIDVDCGFTAGARFVLIKRTDSTGDWYVWDTTRGIVSGNDPYLLLNSTAAEVTNTDYIDPYSAGFEISSTAPAAINASGGSFIFLAIA